MFLDNKYTKWYWAIIESRKAIKRKKGNGVLFENHHIIPWSISKDDTPENKVLLTPKEHFICHLLLTKMTEGLNRRSMINAIIRFMGPNRKYKINSRIYKSISLMNSENMAGKNNPMYGRPWYFNCDDKERIQRWRSNISKGITGDKNPFYGKEHSPETKKILSAHRSIPIRVTFNDGRIEEFSQYKYLGSYLGKSFALGQKLCKEEYSNLREKYGITKLEKLK